MHTEQPIVLIKWNDLYNLFSSKERNFYDSNKQPLFAGKILPSDLFVSLFKADIHSVSPSTVNRVFSNHSSARDRYEEARNLLLTPNPADGELYSYQTLPGRRIIESNWKQLISALSSENPDFKASLVQKLNQLLTENITEDDSLDIAAKLKKLLPEHMEEALTCLTLIASTLSYWNKQDLGSNISLYDLILPPDSSEHLSDLKKKEHAFKKENEEKAIQLLELARSLFQMTDINPESAALCCQKCDEIINLRPLVSKQLRGEAFFMLFKCTQSKETLLPKGVSPLHYLEQSNTLGYEKAAREWKALHTYSLTYQPEKNTSTEKGICIFNTVNARTELLKETIPESWDILSFSDFKTLIHSQLLAKSKKKFFLLDDDFQKNLKDTLFLLQSIKDSLKTGSRQNLEKERQTHMVQNTEIYLRGKEETCSPLIDTALSHMDGCIIPVHILDDEKQAAQRLLSFHPLYYPIRSRSINAEGEIVLNFVVLGSSGYAEWLVREAFWLMSFRNPHIKSKITILSPDGEKMKSRINALCPGMIRNRLTIKNIPLAEVTAQVNSGSNCNIDLDSYELQAEIGKLLERPDEYFYFAVAADSDEKNLAYAIRIREWIIRKYIRLGITEKLEELPVIAFKCEDPDMAHLSRSMVVQMEDYGNRWFNNYALIPFGTRNERYCWTEIHGGILEDMARCIHLQYCGISVEQSNRVNDNMTLSEALDSYYSRQYNRDSSFAVAVSLPYRLFQCNYAGRRMIPSHWSILDESVFSNRDSLAELGERLKKAMCFKTDKEVDALSELEHARWTRFMLARGWMPASCEETISYIKASNHYRQQLYIARLHPCICSYKELAELEKRLKLELNMNKDFYSLDRRNVEMTPEFLLTAWFSRENGTKSRKDLKK